MLISVLVFVWYVRTYNNGVGETPSMGWNSWNQFACNVNETLILETVMGFKKHGLDKAGYQYINIDDCWQLEERDKDGRVQPDLKRFPDIPGLVSKVHTNGLKMGLYTDIGQYTCQHRAGSYGHYDIDAATYKEWNIDYIKVDFCYTTAPEGKEPWVYYQEFSDAINKTGHPMLFSLCNWGVKNPWKWAGKFGHQWRTTGDINSLFQRILEIVEINRYLYPYAAPYQYNDPDMLEVGVIRGLYKMNYEENRAHFSLWCMMAAPLLLGLDVTGDIPSEYLEIITNTEVISVDQDKLGKQGFVIVEDQKHINSSLECDLRNVTGELCHWTQIWKKPLTSDRIAVLFFNHASQFYAHSDQFDSDGVIMSVSWKDLGITDFSKNYHIRSLWDHKDIGTFSGSFTSPVKVKQHDIFMFIMTPMKLEKKKIKRVVYEFIEKY